MRGGILTRKLKVDKLCGVKKLIEEFIDEFGQPELNVAAALAGHEILKKAEW